MVRVKRDDLVCEGVVFGSLHLGYVFISLDFEATICLFCVCRFLVSIGWDQFLQTSGSKRSLAFATSGVAASSSEVHHIHAASLRLPRQKRGRFEQGRIAGKMTFLCSRGCRGKRLARLV